MHSYSAVFFRVFTSDQKHSEMFRYPIPKGFRCTEDHIKQAIPQFISDLEQQFPGNIFRCVKIKPNRYNVIPCNPLG